MISKSNRNAIPAVCGLALLAAAAHAENHRGFYATADLGIAWTPDVELKEYFGPVAPGTELKFDPGVRFGAAGGYRFCDWFSAEIQTGVMSSSIRSISGADDVDAVFSNIPLLANVRFEFPSKCPITPYIGVGAGLSISAISIDEIDLDGTEVEGSDATAVFACQGFAGLRYDLNDRMSLGLEYRYFRTTDPSWDGDDLPGELRFSEVETHAVSFVFQYRF